MFGRYHGPQSTSLAPGKEDLESEPWESEERVSMLSSIWNSWAPSKDSFIHQGIPKMMQYKETITTFLFEYLNKKGAGNLIARYFRLTRYGDILFNEDATCNLIGDVLQRFAHSFSCKNRRTKAATKVVNVIAKELDDEQKVWILTFIHDMLNGEKPLRGNDRTYTGMRWVLHEASKFKLENNASGLIWEYAGLELPDGRKRLENMSLEHTLRDHLSPQLSKLDRISFDYERWTTFKVKELEATHYVEVQGHFFVPVLPCEQVYSREFEKVLSEFIQNPNPIFEEIHRDAPPPNPLTPTVPKNSMYVMESFSRFREYFPNGVKPQSYIAFQVPQGGRGTQSYVFVEETMTGVHSLMSRKLSNWMQGDETEGKYTQQLIGHLLSAANHMYDTTNFLDNVFEEIKKRITCDVKTQDRNYVLSGKVGKRLRVIGVTQMVNSAALFMDRVRSVSDAVVSDAIVGDVLYELGRRLKDPPITEHLMSKVSVNQVLEYVDRNPALKAAKKWTAKLDMKECDTSTCAYDVDELESVKSRHTSEDEESIQSSTPPSSPKRSMFAWARNKTS